jgi:hypothetical protein
MAAGLWPQGTGKPVDDGAEVVVSTLQACMRRQYMLILPHFQHILCDSVALVPSATYADLARHSHTWKAAVTLCRVRSASLASAPINETALRKQRIKALHQSADSAMSRENGSTLE